jgi:hypothetical protein
MRDTRHWASIPQWFYSFVPTTPSLHYSSIPNSGEAPKFMIARQRMLLYNGHRLELFAQWSYINHLAAP